MRRIIIYLLLQISTIQFFYSQQKEELPPLTTKERIYWGTDFNLQIEGNVSLFELAPSIGYRLYRPVYLGLRFPYELYRQNQFTRKYYTQNIAVRPFTNIIVIDNFSKLLPIKSRAGLMLNAEYEILSFNNKHNTNRELSDVFLLGVGFFQKSNKKSAVYISLMFNISNNQYVYYKNPLVRLGFTF